MHRALATKHLLVTAIATILFSISGNASFKAFSKLFFSLSETTGYVIQGTLIVNIIGIALFSLLFFKLFNLNLASFFIDKKSTLQGFKGILILWISVQFIALIVLLFQGQEIVFHQFSGSNVGRFIGQLFGNAPYEELVFRGFFIVQLFLICKIKYSGKKALAISIIVSQLIFALVHIPNRIMQGHDVNLIANTAQVFIGGIIGAFIFVRTKNLIYLVGFHALANVPFYVLEGTTIVEVLTLVLGILIPVFWNKLNPEILFDEFWSLKPVKTE